MEDVKERTRRYQGKPLWRQVSILVLMEDVKEQVKTYDEWIDWLEFQSLF